MTMPLPMRPGHVHCYLVARRRRLHARRHRARAARCRGSAGRRSSRGSTRRSSTIFLTHFHPDHLGAAADVRELTGRARRPGAARRRAGASSSGRTTAGRSVLGGLVPSQRRPGDGDRGADRAGAAATGRSSGPSPIPSSSTTATLLARLGARRRARARGRPADAAAGRCPDRRRPPARADHADRRPLAREPARSARRLPRGARADDRARARRSPTAGTATPITDPVGRARELIAHHDERLRRRGRRARARAAHRLRGVVPALRRRSQARRPPVRRRRDALPSRAARPRGQGRASRRGSRRGRRRRLLYCRAVVGELPSSTAAPETGA